MAAITPAIELRRRRLERALLTHIEEFEQATGCTVYAVRLEHQPRMRLPPLTIAAHASLSVIR